MSGKLLPALISTVTLCFRHSHSVCNAALLRLSSREFPLLTWQHCTVQIFGDKSNKSKFASRGDWTLGMLATIQPRSFSLLFCCRKNVKIRIQKTIILPVVLYGCVTWSLTLREEHTRRLRVFENRVLRRIFGQGDMRWQENGENCITRSFVNCTFHQLPLE
jgi:hypothetical protein